MTSNEETQPEIIQQALPLTGTILGLPKEPVEVKCPSCGLTTNSEVVKEDTTFLQCLAQICATLVFCCTCWCCDDNRCERQLRKVCDRNHYCGNCGCFLGRYDKYYGKKTFCEV